MVTKACIVPICFQIFLLIGKETYLKDPSLAVVYVACLSNPAERPFTRITVLDHQTKD